MVEVRITSGIDEIVEAGRRFGNAWAKLRERHKEKEKWFDTMVIKLDSPTADSFHKILRKMVRELYKEQNEELKWNISTKVLGLLADRARSYWRHAFMTGVFFGYYGYFEEKGGDKK